MGGTNSFKRDKTGWVLVILNLLMALNSTLYFLLPLNASVTEWLAMNSCAPSIFIFALGFIIANRTIMAVGAGLLFHFGILGISAYGWEGINIISQIGHILMLCAVLYYGIRMVRLRAVPDFIIAAFTVLILRYSTWQCHWFNDHPGVYEAVLNGTLKPGSF